MNIHVFNPEHDLALAHNGPRFTPPRAARLLRCDLGFLPFLWAGDGDMIVVDDERGAIESMIRLGIPIPDVRIVQLHRLAEELSQDDSLLNSCQVFPWGWDRAVRWQLLNAGHPQSVVPSEQQIERVRQLSARQTSVDLLRQLTAIPGTVGHSVVCSSVNEVQDVIADWHHVVLKAPWSSSGRGVKYVHGMLTPSLEGWCKHVLLDQHAIVAELYINKVMDFGMEFYAHTDGTVGYEGLSLFDTQNGAYTGSIIASESRKLSLLLRYVPAALLDSVRESLLRLLSPLLSGVYVGPFGIDMMVASASVDDTKDYVLNPCVELNLRRTMGHVALALYNRLDGDSHTMRINFDGRYHLLID